MNHDARICCLLVLAVIALSGCSSESAKGTKKATRPLDRIQGKVQVTDESGGATDAALNAGGHSVYLWEGTRRYRLFLKTPVELEHGKQYVAEGVNAQKAIEEIGDPDMGKNGYPLQASCDRVVRMAWALSFDAVESTATLVRNRVRRYPARPLFLVTRIRPATAEEISSAAAAGEQDKAGDENIPEVAVAADKQRALLIEGPTVLTAPLWEPAGGTARCKLIINTAGKVASLETGAQLCEIVPWSQFRYQPTVQRGRPVKVSTEVEVRFDPLK